MRKIKMKMNIKLQKKCGKMKTYFGKNGKNSNFLIFI